jgi:hypothetical protein
MKKIFELIVVAGLMLVCMPNIHGQGSPGGYLFSATIQDSLSTPVRMAIDNSDNIYVTDAFRKKIRKYNASGAYSGSIVTVASPISIAINDKNQLFIGDGATGKIFRLNSNGTASLFYAGTAFPSSMVFCSDGFLYVSDSRLARIIVLDMSGNVIRTIGAGTLLYPTGITFDRKNNRILVAEHGGIGTGFNPLVKVYIYGLTGNLITSFGSHGNSDGKFYRIQGLAVGRCGEIYVPEPYQGSVSVFTEATIFATRFAHYGDSISQLRVPLDIAINSQDKIFITAENNGKIEVFDIAYLLPTANITCGNKTICEGTTTDIPVHFTGTAPWTFTYTINGANPATVGSTSDNPYILNVSAPGNYQVTAVSDAGAAGTCFSGNSVITVNSVIPTATISPGNVSVCPGQSAIIPVSLTGTPPWSFTYTRNDASPQTISGVMVSPYLLNVTEPGQYAITALTGGGCAGSSFTGVASVTANIVPTATITTGSTSICEGTTTTLSIDFTGTAPWSFTYTVNDANPATLNNIIDNPYLLPVSAAGHYKIIHMQDAFCENTVSAGGPVIAVKTLPTANISSGNAAICTGDSTFLVLDFTGTAPWSFSYTMDGLNLTTVNGVAASPYILHVSQAGIYQLAAVSDASCAGTSFTGTAVITENPLPVVTMVPAAGLCGGDSLILDAGPHQFFLWNDYTMNEQLTVYTAGTYSVTVTDYNGCRNSGSAVISANPLPLVDLGPDVTIDAGAMLTLDAGPSRAGYFWSDGSTGQTLQVTSAGMYGVTVTDNNGCHNSDLITVSVVVPLNKDLQNITVAGQQCFSATQTITVAGNGSTFTVENGGSVTLIAGSNIICLPGVKVVPGGYLHGYITQNNTYCGGVSPPIVALANELTTVPVCPVAAFTGQTDGLTFSVVNNSLNATSYLWDFGDRTTSAEAEPVHTYDFPGSYMVSLTASNGTCSDSMASQRISAFSKTTGKRNPGNLLKLYPNPTRGLVTIDLKNPGQEDLKIEIKDMAGRHIYSKDIHDVHFTEQIDLGGFSMGIYVVHLSSPTTSNTTKLVLID